MPERACIDCGVPTNGTRCPRHRREHRRKRKARGLTGERGSTRSSRKRRHRVLAKANGLCFYCSAPAQIADHFMPRSRGGPDIEANLVAACTECNRAKGEQLPGAFLHSEWLRARRAARRAELAAETPALAGGARDRWAGMQDTGASLPARKTARS